MRIEIAVLGPLTLWVDGVQVALTVSEAKTLALLVAADGVPVPVSALHAELWPDSLDSTHRRRGSRTDVQKRILRLRRAMDPDGTDDARKVLRTETVAAGQAPETAYQLVLEVGQLDCARFESLVERAMAQAPATAATTLADALELWRGTPLAEAGDAPFGRTRIRRLRGLFETAASELVQIRVELGQPEAALRLAEQIAERHPDDETARERTGEIRRSLRARRADEILRREFPGLRARLSVVRGDLFDQNDANLVVGFTDTFDTSTHRNELISVNSVQGQMLHRVYGGDVAVLDRELRRGLRQVAPVGRELPRDKPKGKRVRYPVGTVVPLPHQGGWIFAVAYCRQGNDLMGRSSPSELRLSLERLWHAVALRGQLRPVAIPIVGSGLARVRELSRPQLAAMIIETFTAAQRGHTVVAPELRIVIRPQEIDESDLPTLARFTESLDQDGRRPDE
jgi:DNA-binding SARP family transcriptional activator